MSDARLLQRLDDELAPRDNAPLKRAKLLA